MGTQQQIEEPKSIRMESRGIVCRFLLFYEGADSTKVCRSNQCCLSKTVTLHKNASLIKLIFPFNDSLPFTRDLILGRRCTQH